jgi:probable HAF family extracellular repeat protein
MNHTWIGRFPLRRPALAGLAALLAGSAVNGAGAAASAAPAAESAAVTRYSIINLDPEGGAAAFLNERGEAAVGSFVFGTRRFFDGDRLHDIGTLGGEYSSIRGLNNRGVVVGDASDASTPFPAFHGYTWTVAGGIRAIPGSDNGIPYAINDNNQVVGQLPAPGVSARAVRWEPDGRVVNLGPTPFSLSEARAVNNDGLAVGYSDFTDGTIHASAWGGASKYADLGTLGGGGAFAELVNERGEVSGYADTPVNNTERAFYWDARDGVVPTGAQGFPVRLASALNDKGEITGNTDVPGGSAAYLWSRARGLTLLPRGGAVRSDAFDINNKTQIVGGLESAGGALRAVRWNGLAVPVDLNTLLYRPPAGLVLNAGIAINDAGTILAASNAGLVMLRPGTHGTDAPVLGPIAGLPFEVDNGAAVHLTLGFVDNSATQTHTAVVDWSDGCASPAPVVTESGGVGQVAFQHRFCRAGTPVVTVRVTDSGGRTTEARKDVIVNAPGLATIAGRGVLAHVAAPTGTRALPLRFALWAPLDGAAGAMAGMPFVRFDGALQFRSDQVGKAVRSGQDVRLEGTGRLNGHPGYRFQVDAGDGGGQAGDRLRVRVLHTEAGKEVVDYDNGAPAGAATAAVAVALSATTERTRVTDGDIAIHN